MTLTRSVPWLLAAGGILLLVTIGFIATGNTVGIGNRDTGSLILCASLICFALAAGIASMAGTSSRATRIGLGLLAIGLLVTVGTSLAATALPYDPLESVPLVVLALMGFLAILLGLLVTVIAVIASRTSGTG